MRQDITSNFLLFPLNKFNIRKHTIFLKASGKFGCQFCVSKGSDSKEMRQPVVTAVLCKPANEIS